MANGLFNLKQVIQAVQQGGWPAQKTPAVEYLVVAGGGGGGSNAGGGGGAGGLLTGLDPVPNGQTLVVTVGGGGAGVTVNNVGNAGVNSVFGNITATGGGRGGGYGGVATSGGSGGGGGGGNSEAFVAQGTAGQGNAGTTGQSSASPYVGGGGGGAGTVGTAFAGTAPAVTGGSGGAGIASSITGTVTTYAGGGGGSIGSAGSSNGSGGVGGGGAGATSGGGNATSGSANTGGGGGGASTGTSGSGGNGIVIVSYPDVYAAATTVNATASTSGSGSILLNGSTQWLTYPSNAAYAYPSDFTVEFWINPSNWSATNMFVYGTYSSGAPTGGILIGKVGSNFTVRAANVGDQLTYGTLPTTSTWTHVAIVRSGTVLSMFFNGTKVATATNTYSYAQSDLSIGRENGGSAFAGYISNVRAVKGTAVYDPLASSITVPTAPLTAISGTSFLLNTVSGAYSADGSTISAAPTVYTTAQPTWNQLSPFTGTGYKNRVYTWTTSGTITF